MLIAVDMKVACRVIGGSFIVSSLWAATVDSLNWPGRSVLLIILTLCLAQYKCIHLVTKAKLIV